MTDFSSYLNNPNFDPAALSLSTVSFFSSNSSTNQISNNSTSLQQQQQQQQHQSSSSVESGSNSNGSQSLQQSSASSSASNGFYQHHSSLFQPTTHHLHHNHHQLNPAVAVDVFGQNIQPQNTLSATNLNTNVAYRNTSPYSSAWRHMPLDGSNVSFQVESTSLLQTSPNSSTNLFGSSGSFHSGISSIPL